MEWNLWTGTIRPGITTERSMDSGVVICMTLLLPLYDSVHRKPRPPVMTPHQPPTDYQALIPLGGPELRLRFRGPFEGREIMWDARFVTRRHSGAECNSIEIGAEGPHGRCLTVVLDVSCFDAPTVSKAIIMMRQYKRLRRGRHEFGNTAP